MPNAVTVQVATSTAREVSGRLPRLAWRGVVPPKERRNDLKKGTTQ
jgi:hypothetical protein